MRRKEKRWMTIIDLSKKREQSLWVGVGQKTPQWQQTVEKWSGEKKRDNLRGETNFLFCFFLPLWHRDRGQTG